MRSSIFSGSLLVLVATALSALHVGCAAESADDTDSTEDEVKKKVKPKAGNGAFDLLKPSWSTDGFAGQHVFGDSTIAPGGRVERVPGSYSLSTRNASFEHGRLMGQNAPGYTLGVGTILNQKVAGLAVRFAEPVTLGKAFVDFTPVAPAGQAGNLDPTATWRTRAEGARMFVLPGTAKIRSTADAATFKDLVFSQGTLTEHVLPVARVKVAGDEYDAGYPTTRDCAAPFIRAGAAGYEEQVDIRKPDGSMNATTYVIPQGPNAPVTLHTYGLQTPIATVSGTTHSFTVNRLEVDDVEVNAAGGGTQMVRGVFTIQRKNGANLVGLSCTFPTHTGVDLPDGTYVITSSASSVSGPVKHVEELSFP